MVPGRFAPSPTGRLHVGNLRTAVVAWLFARSASDRFLLRIEDLDRVASSDEHERAQRADLAALGVDWDEPVWRQSRRFGVYDDALSALTGDGLTYECYCSRREIREAAAAPHGAADLIYPGTCRDLPAATRSRRGAERPPAIRFRAPEVTIEFDDAVAGCRGGAPWDVVLRRNDGVPAYNLAVVVDDAAAGVDLVVRGDDLVPATPSQLALARALGLPSPRYAHVGLVVGSTGQRLAKRDGAITLAELAAGGTDVDTVRAALAESLGLGSADERPTAAELVDRFDALTVVDHLRSPVTLDALLTSINQ